MSQPFYVSPEQVMKDRADYARKGIARGRSLVALECADGVLLVAENPSRTLFKISELYDRIAFAGVGKYNEFQSLKIGGVRLADLKGYQYSREDVTANGIANAYAQTLGQVFTHEMKPYEVEILVAQVGSEPDEPNELFHILYDGTVMDEEGFELGALDAAERASRAVAVQQRDLELIGRRRALLPLAEHPGAQTGRRAEVEPRLVGLLEHLVDRLGLPAEH
ncbi:MAG: proteasome subunit alpha, partial [Acidimicrobiia bacterium]